MVSITRFEDIEAWQCARELVRAVYHLGNEGAFARDFGPRDQIRRAAVSTRSNIAEGYGRGGNKEFMQFLSTAKGSVLELQSHLHIARDLGYISDEEFNDVYNLGNKTVSMIAGLMRYRSHSPMKGVKFRER